MGDENHDWYLRGLVEAKELLAAKICDPNGELLYDEERALCDFEKELMALIKDRSGEEWDELIRRLNK